MTNEEETSALHAPTIAVDTDRLYAHVRYKRTNNNKSFDNPRKGIPLPMQMQNDMLHAMVIDENACNQRRISYRPLPALLCSFCLHQRRRCPGLEKTEDALLLA